MRDAKKADSGFGIRDSGFGIRDSGFGIRDSGFGIRKIAAMARWPQMALEKTVKTRYEKPIKQMRDERCEPIIHRKIRE